MQLWLAVLAVRIIHSIRTRHNFLKEKMYVEFNPLQLCLPLSHCNLVKDFLEANKIETPYQKVTNFFKEENNKLYFLSFSTEQWG